MTNNNKQREINSNNQWNFESKSSHIITNNCWQFTLSKANNHKYWGASMAAPDVQRRPCLTSGQHCASALLCCSITITVSRCQPECSKACQWAWNFRLRAACRCEAASQQPCKSSNSTSPGTISCYATDELQPYYAFQKGWHPESTVTWIRLASSHCSESWIPQAVQTQMIQTRSFWKVGMCYIAVLNAI